MSSSKTARRLRPDTPCSCRPTNGRTAGSCATATCTRACTAGTSRRRMFPEFSCRYPLGDRQHLVAGGVPGHEDEEDEVDERAKPRHPRRYVPRVEEEGVEAQLPPHRGRLCAEVAEG